MVKKIKVCTGVSCSARGSKNLINKISKDLGVRVGTCNDNYCLDYCLCTAHCEKGINVRVDDKIAHMVKFDNWQEKIDNPEEVKIQEVKVEVKDDFLGDI